MTTKKVLKKIVKNGVEMHLPQNNVFVITEDKLTKTTTATKGVAPYNTDYYYTNYQISATAGVKWIEGALYTFMINTKTTASAYRNVRVQIGTGSYIPVMSSSGTILGGSSYFTKANDRIYQYSTRYESGGALHLITDSNTTYSSMSADEGKTGTATSARSLTAANLKAIIEYHAGNLHDDTKQDTLTAGEGITIDENNVISAEGGGGADTNTINALIDVKLKDSDPVFQITSGLYKILNDMDGTDSCGLTEGDSRAEIVANETSMNLISHSWNIMSKVVSSDTAMSGIVGSSTAKTQMLQSWKAMELIMNSPLAVEYFSDTTILSSVLSSAVGLDALRDSDIAIEVLSGKTLTQSLWNTIMGDSIIGPKVANDNDLLDSISKNESALKGLISNSTAWGIVLGDYEKSDIVMRNNGSVVIANDTASHLNGDNSLRAIINNNLLDSYIAKGEDCSNNVIVFDIDSDSATSFGLSRYGYNAVTSTWKISVDGGAWDEQSVAASTTALSINLGSTGKHTIVIKPDTLAVGWARQMGNKNSSNYWGLTGYTWSIRNLPVYAFTSSSTSATNYCLYYAFYGVTNLTSVNIKMPSTMTAVGNYFMAYAFRGCTALKSLGTGFNLGTVTSSVGTYLLYYTWYGCTALTGLPFGFKLPTVGNSTYYMRYTWSNCTNLTSDSPAENLTFIYAATNCFTSSGISTASPGAGSSIAVHRI